MKKRCLAVVMTGLVFLAAVGCGSSGIKMTASTTDESSAAYDVAEEEIYAEDAGTGVTSENGLESVSESDRKLIKTVYLDLQTKEFDQVLEGLTAKVSELGGYVESSSLNGNSYYYTSTRSAYYTVRIPSDRLDEFVQVVSELGNVTYKNESVEDVTLQYVDTESRKKALETERDRLLELMEQAENMEDLLAIESKLSEVRYELENYGSQLRLLDNQIDYSTVNVDINEVERLTETKELTFFEEVSNRFSDSLYDVGHGLRGFAIWFLGSLPILVVWAVVIVAIVLVVRMIFRKKRNRKIQKDQSEEK